MNTKIISPKMHGLIDYALVAGLLTLPSILGFSKKVKRIYTTEGLLLFGYIACTEHPTAVVPLIPFKIHGKIDPFNVAQFAAQTLSRPFQKDKDAMYFNIGFTIISAALVALTNWDGETKREKETIEEI